ncbi:ATP-binding protein [Amycolatopsis alkalitolerans]|uniref:AAA family ATPase n=1 Tax=Amycolatopsis alkalitolerans TaxID=2547244 RepID=A0A5C4MA60_9PSEU|nr:BTAD domain-containing putative transcriptional regulator [Amycolatopsis alkalitolerans]TNC28244.1 AAA family ATPase [Amycolatopsis alkalitolerans]
MSPELVLLPRVAFRGREITGPRLCNLLALLAADLRTGCSTARLIDRLWPDDKPENPAKALQILISRARTQLGSDTVARTPAGYRLTLTEDQVDAAAVVRLAAAATQHADPSAALREAEAGLALWEGEAETGPDPLAELRADRASARQALHRARALALARLGRHAEAVDVLSGAFHDRPRDEEVLLELLRSEAASAGSSAALTRYETYRRALRDELGIDPGAELQALYQRLLQPAVRHGVQHEPNDFLGREGDLAAVLGLLRTARVTSVVGPGGLGKTRLAHAVAREADQRVVHFVPLAGVSRDEDVVGEIASVLGVGETRQVVAMIAQALGPALLVLDNCEHVVTGVAEFVRALVSMTRDLRVLTTSRAPLGLSSESAYLLPELDLATSVELFAQRARAARPGVDLPAEAVEDLCRHLDGLPLAVELAAARVRTMSVAEVARRLTDRFALLRGAARDAPARHRTLEAVVEWSWQLLDLSGQTAMTTLSVFPGGFTEAGAHRLGASVDELVDQSLLKVSDTPSGTRFRMLETVREFAAAKRTDDRVIEDFLDWAREFGLACYEAPFGPDPAPATGLIRVEQDNLLQALRYAVEREDGDTVAAVAAVLAVLWTFETNYGRMAPLIDDVGRLLSHYHPKPEFVEVTRAAAALCTAYAFTVRGPRAMRTLLVLHKLPPAPPDTLIRAVAAGLVQIDRLNELRDSPEPLLAGYANAVVSYLWENVGDMSGARAAAERMLEVFASGEYPWMRILALFRLAEIHMHLGEGAEALPYIREAWVLQEELGVWLDEIGFRWSMVLASLQAGAVDEAERWFNTTPSRRADERFAYGSFDVAVSAELALARGEIDEGLASWRRAVELVGEMAVPGARTESELEPWSLELKSVAVVAHARHGRLDLVEDLVAGLPRALSRLLAEFIPDESSYLAGLPLYGALLLALGRADLARGHQRSGLRLVALAERFRYLRQFQPTMSLPPETGQPAYAEVASSYAGLDTAELQAAALATLRDRG